MDNAAIADNFALLAKLMDIHGENSFKTKTYAIAAFNIEKLPEPLSDTPRETLFSIKGIGDSVGKKVVEMLDSGKLELLSDYLEKTPPGILEMLNIKGIGPKKINTIWKEMSIESLGELLYACNENRLTLYKGFGEKTQKNVQEAIEFYTQNQGSFLFAQLNELFPQVDGYLKKLFSPDAVRVTGAYRRHEPTIDELEFIILEENALIKPRFETAQPPELLAESSDTLLYRLKNGLKLKLYTGKSNRARRLFETTGSASFVAKFNSLYPDLSYNGDETTDDEIIFEKAQIPFIPPFLRETETVIGKAISDTLPLFIEPGDIRAIIHSHSKWSDGAHSIEEMARECIRKGFEYLVLSDHSKAAFYANGLTEERIREQHRQIDELNARLHPFKIFKSIECDILNDGSLDYSDEILATFDLVIASVHTNLKMPEEKAMARLLKAISNPYVTILGHLTGRLLLSRNGYPLDHRKIIDACIQNHIVIELNAHPRRLDIDWRWIEYVVDQGGMISINPDAHALDGYDDIRYGVLAAQKGGLTREQNLSSFTLHRFEAYLAARKKLKGI